MDGGVVTEQVVDDYALEVALGTGCTGSAWLASSRAANGLRRQVVLKLLDPARAGLSARVDELLVERDPRVVRYEAVERASGGRPAYTVTDRASGRPWSTLREEASLAARVGVLRGLAEALAALHARGLCHGDLRPSNLLVRRERSGALIPLLLDAGVVPVRDPAWHDAPPRAERLFPYLAPEAEATFLPGARLLTGPAQDVYALGATACALLTGAAPGTLEGERTPAEIARGKRRRSALLALPEPGAPLDLERLNLILERTLARRPEERPSALWAADALQASLTRPLAARR
jgi:serine/threonine-protein kinase